MSKKSIIFISVIILIVSVLLLANNLFGIFSLNTLEGDTCPSECISLWQYDSMQNECSLNDCGSGCGANNITTFIEEDSCLEVVDTNEDCFSNTKELWQYNITANNCYLNYNASACGPDNINTFLTKEKCVDTNVKEKKKCYMCNGESLKTSFRIKCDDGWNSVRLNCTEEIVEEDIEETFDSWEFSIKEDTCVETTSNEIDDIIYFETEEQCLEFNDLLYTCYKCDDEELLISYEKECDNGWVESIPTCKKEVIKVWTFNDNDKECKEVNDFSCALSVVNDCPEKFDDEISCLKGQMDKNSFDLVDFVNNHMIEIILSIIAVISLCLAIWAIFLKK